MAKQTKKPATPAKSSSNSAPKAPTQKAVCYDSKGAKKGKGSK